MTTYRIELLENLDRQKLSKVYLYGVAMQLLEENNELKRRAREFIAVAHQPRSQRWDELKFELWKLL